MEFLTIESVLIGYFGLVLIGGGVYLKVKG